MGIGSVHGIGDAAGVCCFLDECVVIRTFSGELSSGQWPRQEQSGPIEWFS